MSETFVGRAGRVVKRHPRLWGALFAVLLAVVYMVAVRPARVALGQEVAFPLFASVETERSAGFEVTTTPQVPGAVLAVPLDPALKDQEQVAGTALWSPPAGALWVFPAMFLLFTFPTRPYWLWLLGYHLAIGLVAALVFAIGIGYAEPAFALYTFSRTYMTETVSLAIPLLLWLAGRAEPSPETVEPASAAPSAP